MKFSSSDNESENLIFDLAPFPMWIYDLETYAFLSVNQEAVRQYGYSEAEFLQMTLKDIRPLEDLPALDDAIAATRKRKEVFKENGLYRHQKKDGTIIYVHIRSNLITFQGKKSEIVTAIDLSERYDKEREIEEQKRFLATVGRIHEILLKSDNWPLALKASFEILGDLLQVNRICFYEDPSEGKSTVPKVSWCSNEEFGSINPMGSLTKTLFEKFSNEKEANTVVEFFEILVSNLPNSEIKNELRRQKTKSLVACPLTIDNILVGILTLEDCRKERMWKESETQLLKTLLANLAYVINQDHIIQKLADSEARFKSLVQNGNDLIAIIDTQGNYAYVAPNSLNILGLPAEEFSGKNAFEYIHQDDIPKLRNDLLKIATMKSLSLEPFRFLDSENNWRWIKTDLINHLDDPLIAGVVANSREVTLEVQKRMSEQLLSNLTRIISHSGSLTDCLTDAMREISERCDFSITEMWLIAEDKSRLDLISKSGHSSVMEIFYPDSLGVHSFGKGKNLPGLVWLSQEIQIMENLGYNMEFLRTKSALKANLQTGVGFPVVYNKEFLGCIVCLSKLSKKELLPQVEMLSELCGQIAAVLKQKMTEVHYYNFFNITPDPHGILGFDGYLKKVNNAFANLLGYEIRELLERPIFDFIFEDDRTKGLNRLKQLTQDPTTDSFEIRFLTKQGDIKWLVWKGTVIQESKIIFAVAKDITDQKQAELELKNANDRLKRAQKIAKLGYWFRDLSSDVAEWSDETYRIHGYTPDNFTPTLENLKRIFHPEDRYLLESDPTVHLEPGIVHKVEHRIITASNEVKWVMREIRLLTDERQVPYRIEGTIQDITERKENELQLEISNERFQLAIKASNEMIWEVDHQKRTIYRGAGYRQLVDYAENEPFSINNSWCRKLSSTDMERVWASLENTLADKNATFWSAEYKITNENGTFAYFVDRCYILRDTHGNPLRSIGSVLDVTPARQQLERIKEQNIKLKQIAWLQSHVIRAPLSRIMSLIYLMKEYEGGGKSIEELVDLISVSAEELDQVIQEIITKTEAVKEDDDTNPID